MMIMGSQQVKLLATLFFRHNKKLDLLTSAKVTIVEARRIWPDQVTTD